MEARFLAKCCNRTALYPRMSLPDGVWINAGYFFSHASSKSDFSLAGTGRNQLELELVSSFKMKVSARCGWCLMPVLLLFGKPRQVGRHSLKTSLSSRVRLYLKSRHD